MALPLLTAASSNRTAMRLSESSGGAASSLPTAQSPNGDSERAEWAGHSGTGHAPPGASAVKGPARRRAGAAEGPRAPGGPGGNARS